MWVKFIFALIPIVLLIISLTALKMPAAKAAVISLILAIILAITAFQLPVVDTLTGTLEGILGGLFPIVYIIVAAMFTSKVTFKSGAMQKIQDMLCGLTTDKRVLVLLIAWGFGGFLEAIAGFGTAVAIPASILMTFGINPIEASVICLVANTTPTAFGAVGLPVITLAQTAGLDVMNTAFVVSLQLSVLILVIPYILVGLVGGGVKAIKGVGFITFMSGLAFALPQILVAKYVGAELPAIAGSIVCILVTALLAKRHKDVPEYSASTGDIAKHSAGELLQACAPFILVFVFVLAASSLFPAVNSLLNSATLKFQVYTGKNTGQFSLNWLSSPGTLILVATFIGAMIQGLSVKETFGILWDLIKGIVKTAVTISAIVALAKVMGYAGMTSAIAVVLVKVMGPVYPLIAPIIGALGTFVTGSDTSSNILFAKLQASAAQSLGVSQTWVVANNMVGATAGKMISPQSITVASTAIGQEGSEGTILKQAFKWCGIYTAIICIFLYLVGLATGQLHF